MNDSLSRKFCESRHRWLIVATATVLAALTVILPLVDVYFNNRSSRNELSEDLVEARQTAASLPKFESQANEVQNELEALEVRTVDDGSLARFRSRLVDVVRESGCQIRRIEVSAPVRRPWKEQDDPLSEMPPMGSSSATPFALERRSVTLGVDGAMAAVHDLLARLQKEQTMSHPHRVQLQAVSSGGETVTLELELWLFALSRTPA